MFYEKEILFRCQTNNILKYTKICPQSSGSMSLEVANRMYIQASFNVLKDFRRTVRKTFGSDTKEVNFEKNHEKARRIINNWVEKRTRHKIKQMIGPGNHVSHNNDNAIILVYTLNKPLISVFIDQFCDTQSLKISSP
jgi:serine protease inhibitor